jgi:peptide chain release factor 1
LTRWTIGKYDQSAVRLTHIPTGLVAMSGSKNHNIKIKTRHLAFCVPRLYEQELAKKQAEDATKRTQVFW